MRKISLLIAAFLCFGIGAVAAPLSMVRTSPAEAANPGVFPDGTGKNFNVDLTASTGTDYLNVVSNGGTLNYSSGTGYKFFDSAGAQTAYLSTYAPYKNFTMEFDVTAHSDYATATSNPGYVIIDLGRSSQFTTGVNQAVNPLYIFFNIDSTFYHDTSDVRLSWASPLSSANLGKKHRIKVDTSNGTIAVYFDDKLQGNFSVDTSKHTGYLAVAAHLQPHSFTVSNFSMVNKDNEEKPETMNDTTIQKTFNYDLNQTYTGYLSADVKGAKFSTTYSGTDFKLDASTGEFTFKRTANGDTVTIPYTIKASGYSDITGNLVFNQRTHENSTLLTKATPSKVEKVAIRNFPSDVMPITGWVAPRASRGCNTQAEYDELAESGLNIAIANEEKANTEDAVNAAKYAQNAGVYYMGAISGSTAQKRVDYINSLANGKLPELMAVDNFIGMLTKDEPGSQAFNDQNLYREALENAGAGELLNYCNLLPIVASNHQLETGEWIGGQPETTTAQYQAYLNSYISVVKPTFISYDNYPETGAFPQEGNRYFENLRMIRETAKKNNLPFWSFNLATGHMGYRIPTEEDMQWSINTSLAYGAKGIQYFCYQMPWNTTQSGWYSYGGSFIDIDGNKTANYTYGQKINKQIARMDHILMNSSNIEVNYVNGGISDFISQGGANQKNNFREMSSVTSTGNLLMGCFDYNGKTVIYFVNNDVSNSLTATAKFSSYVEGNLYMTDGDAKMNGKGLTFSLLPGRGMLLELTNYQNDFEAIDATTGQLNIDKEEYEFTGKEIKPTETVKFAGLTLTKGVDYEVDYENNVEAGLNAKVVINFIGRYKGSLEKTFKIIKTSPSFVDPTAKEGLIYNGEEQTLLNPGYVTDEGLGEMLYSLEETSTKTWSNQVPKAKKAGIYTVYYYVKASTESGMQDSDVYSINVEIAKKDVTITGETNQETYYSKKAQTPVEPTVSDGLSITNVIIYDSEGQVVTEAKDVGTYKFTYVVTDPEGNYNEKSFDVTFTILEALDPGMTKPTAKGGLEYNGSEQLLVNAGGANHGTMYYSLDNQNWSVSVPTAKNAGTYTVYYKVIGDEGYFTTEVESLDVSISKVYAKPDTDISVPKLVYNGSSQALVNNANPTNGQYQFTVDGNQLPLGEIPTKTDAGNYIISYVFYPEDTTNYIATQQLGLIASIEKATPEVTYKKNQVFEYTGEDITIEAPVSTLEIKLYSITDIKGMRVESISEVGVYEYHYGIDGNNNYDELFFNIKVTVTRSIQFLIDKYLSLSPSASEITGKTGLYKQSKDVLMSLGENNINLFRYSEDYKEAREKYLSWANMNKDNKPFENNYDFLNAKTGNGCGGSIGIGAFSSLLLVGAGVTAIVAKKQHKKSKDE